MSLEAWKTLVLNAELKKHVKYYQGEHICFAQKVLDMNENSKLNKITSEWER